MTGQRTHSGFTAIGIICGLLACLAAGCDPSGGGSPAAAPATPFHLAGQLEEKRLDEASGIQEGSGGRFYLHNDEGNRLFVTDAAGRDLGSARIEGGHNRDWEDIARVPGPDGPLLVIGDVGDNEQLRRNVSLYFVREPTAAESIGPFELVHRLRFRYPDGPRDVESMAYDAAGDRLLLLSKRDHPPRLYGIPLDLALWKQEATAQFLGELPEFRPPTPQDLLKSPNRGMWVSQATGMDISPDGRLAAVITYRSLYLFARGDGENWPEAFQRPPREFVGPPGFHDEAVGFSRDGRWVYVTTEGRPAPLYRLELPQELREPRSE